MKKIFVAILAAATLVACAQDDIVSAPKGAAIGFDNPFVNNATRAAADLTATNLTGFAVYGSVEKGENKGLIFYREEVRGTQGNFTYNNVQYWVPSASYYFVALAPLADAAWTYTLTTPTDAEDGTISFTNPALAEQDVIYAYSARQTPESITDSPGTVAFDFEHILSRVKFTFVNGFASTSNITLKVTEVHILNTHASASLAVVDGALAANWASQNGELNVDFNDAGAAAIANNNGEAETEHHYLVPDAGAADASTKTSYNVTFKVELIQAGVTVGNYDRTATVAVNLQKGCSYDIKAVLSAENVSPEGEELQPIVFDVNTVDAWATGAVGDATVTVPSGN